MARGSARARGHGFSSHGGAGVSIDINTDSVANAKRYLAQLSKDLDQKEIGKVIRRAGLKFLRLVRSKTPMGLTGRMKDDWRIEVHAGGAVSIANDNPAIQFVEFGTRAHGPVRAKALFIPLTRDAVLTGYREGMEFGDDFVLAKKVRGIRALRFVQRATLHLPDIIKEEGEKQLRERVPAKVNH